jgi:hypothetical protein
MALGPPTGAAAEQNAGQSFVLTGSVAVPLEEVPAFGKEESSGRVQYRFPRGQSAGCVPTPSGEVKAYPTLKSKRPLYGSVKFDASPYEAAIGTTYHFVLDETCEAEKKPEAGGGPGDSEPQTDASKTAGSAQASKPSLLKELAKDLTATRRPADPFAREVIQVIKQTYDLLYFDRNGDLDLTNDGVVRLTNKPLFEAMPPGQMRGLSGEIELSFDFGPPLGKRPFPVAVAVYAYQGANDPFSFQIVGGFGIPGGGIQTAMVSFVPKTVRRGTFKLGEEQYVTWLSQSMMITGRYDRPSTRFDLMRVDRSANTMLLQPGTLGQIYWVGEQLVSISTTPLGDTLTIEPYRGETGILELGSGGRAITAMGLAGTLMSRTGTTLLGSRLGSYPLPATLPRRYTLPVGDYTLPSLTAQYGRLRFSGRIQTVSAPSSASSSAKPPTFLIQIRKDVRSVLEFTGKPEVVFSNPTKEQSFRLGDKVAIRAMLTEPWQNFQITGLWDLTRKERDITYRREGGDIVVPQYARLDPTIAIKNAAGRVVAEGTMPFG